MQLGNPQHLLSSFSWEWWIVVIIEGKINSVCQWCCCRCPMSSDEKCRADDQETVSVLHLFFTESPRRKSVNECRERCKEGNEKARLGWEEKAGHWLCRLWAWWLHQICVAFWWLSSWRELGRREAREWENEKDARDGRRMATLVVSVCRRRRRRRWMATNTHNM